MDLGRSLDQVLQVSASEEVAKVNEFTVVLIFDYNQLAMSRTRQ